MKSKTMRLLVMQMTMALVGIAFGETYTWKGGTGAFSDTTMWMSSGGGAPGDGADLVFPAGDNVVTGVGTLTVNGIVLNGSLELQYGSAGGTFTVNGVISGTGALKSTGNLSEKSYICLNGDNTFSGGYTNYGGQTKLGHDNCLGSGVATFYGNGKPAPCLYAVADVTLTNDLTIGSASGGGWSGPINANGKTLTFAGAVRYENKAVASRDGCFRFTSGKTVHKGAVTIAGTSSTGFVCDGSVTFEKAIRPAAAGYTFGCQINGGTPTVSFMASGNAISGPLQWKNSSGTYVFGAPNVLATPISVAPTSEGYQSGDFYVDLRGNDQVIESFYDGSKNLDSVWARRKMYSSTPARCTMLASANRKIRGAFNDKVTLCWAPTGNYTYTIEGVESTTSAGLVVSNGAVSVTDGASFPKVTEIEVMPGAALSFASGCACNTTIARMVLGSTDGTSLNVADGATFTVSELYVVDPSGTMTRQPGGAVYTSAEIPAIGPSVTVVTKDTLTTYIGPNGGKWSEADNWADKMVPAAGASIGVADGISSVEVDVTASIKSFTAPADAALTLFGDGKIVLGSDQVVFENNKTLTVQCEIAGSGQLVSRGAGALRLEHANTYTGGTLRDCDVISGSSFAGSILVGNRDALGTGRVEMRSHASLSVAQGVAEVTNDVIWSAPFSESPQFYSHLQLKGATVFRGTLDFSQTACARVKGQWSGVTFNDLVLKTTTSLGWDEAFFAGADTYRFSGKVSGMGVLSSDSDTCWQFASSSNELYAVYFWNSQSGDFLDSYSRDIFLDSTHVIFRTGSGARAQGWRLHGFDQTVEGAYDLAGDAPVAHVHYVSTDDGKPARLTMRGVNDRTFSGLYKGPLSVCWNPKGNYALTLAGGAHTMSGALVASNGTVNVTAGTSFAELGAIEVANGARVSFASGTSLKPRIAKLVLQDGATLEFADETELLVDELWTVDAAGNRTLRDPDTVYTGAEIPALRGLIIRTSHHEMPSVPVTWTANGADTALSTDANWSQKPDLGLAETVATFAQKGSVATATADAVLKGIVFGQAAPFELAGLGVVSLYEAGVTVQGTGSELSDYTVSAPLAICSSSTWTLSADTTLVLRGPVTGCETTPNAHSVTVAGNGALDWYGNAGTSCAAEFVFSNKAVNVHGQAFGSSKEGRLVFTDYPEGNTRLSFQNAVVNQAVDLFPQDCEDVRWGSTTFFTCLAGTTNVFNGPVHLHGNYVRFMCQSNARCVFAGGMSNEGSYCPVPLGSGTYVITNTPIHVSCWWSDTSGHTVIAVPGNSMSFHLGNTDPSGVTSSVRLDVDNAVVSCPELYLSSRTLLDLNGHDFGAGRLMTGSVKSSPEVRSLTPATLFVTNVTSVQTHPVRFTGAVSFVKGGSKDLILSGVSTSTGTVEVARGSTLSFGDGGSWCNATKVTVRQGATLSLAGSRTFGRKTDLYLDADAARLEIKTARTTQFVHNLHIGGTKMDAGTWGATGSLDANGCAPEHVDDVHFSGSGVLTVRGNPGMALIVR